MKKIFLLGLVVSLSANTASALEMSGAKLINHKEIASPNVTASFKNINASDSFMKLIKNHLLDKDEIIVSTNAYSNAGYTNEAVQLRGASYVFIRNKGNSKHTYLINTNICTDTHGSQDECSTVSDWMEVDAGGQSQLNVLPSMTYKYSSVGRYNVSMFTSVLRDDQPAFATSSYGLVEINDASY